MNHTEASQSHETTGLVCPRCGCGHFRVIYTRPRRNGTVLRRRECRHCGRRMLTVEAAVGEKNVPPV